MVSIGSRALKFWFPDLPREPKDYDVVGTYEELQHYVRYNYEKIKYSKVSRPGEKYFIKLHAGPCIEFELVGNKDSCAGIVQISRVLDAPQVLFSEVNLQCQIAPPEVLMAVKKSHLSAPLKNWDKHIIDYHFLKNKGVSVYGQFDWNVYTPRLYETSERWSTKAAKLDMTNEEFFDKSEPKVKRYFVHDDIHQAIAYYQKPLFTNMKKDQSKAACDVHLFQALSPLDKIRAVREEAFSIALERRVIPAIMDSKPFDQTEALKYALFRICTTLTGGWFRGFTQENYPEILDVDVDYVAKFRQAYAAGTIRLKELIP